MKVAIIFACLVASIYAETCSNDSDCTDTKCTSGHASKCLQLVFGRHECVCSDGEAGGACTGASDCTSTKCRIGSAHCVDKFCRCYGGIGGIGK
ncbi:serine protease inhibitor Cvsi-2-like [Mytilus trossulus]|uniref:serine protease inhibitor Cvsi-2-like n=1 Tax=Mytilus trossulus TaxID=6551 RepID=UPI0030049CE0